MPVVLIAQLTDTHITRDGAQAQHLIDAIGWINTRPERPAALLVSGDMANTGSREQYLQLREVLAQSRVPVYVVPGNHDRREPLRGVLPDAYYPGARGAQLNYTVDIGAVRVVALDTTEPGRLGGAIDAASLAWLGATFDELGDRPVLIFMHHPPFRTGVNLADVFGFKGLSAFRALVARRRAPLRIVAGHVHCERHAQIGSALASTSISTAPQHVPEVFERRVLGMRPEPAGFTTHAWTGSAFASTTYIRAGGGFVARAAE